MAHALEALLLNPYRPSAPPLAEAAAELVRAGRPAFERLLAKHRPDELALALLHARALRGEPFDDALRGVPALRGLGDGERARLTRVAEASARCVARLTLLHGVSSAMARVRQEVWAACFGASLVHGALLERVVRDHDVLVTGETGTGKELVARALGDGSPSPHGSPAPFAELNAAAVPDALVESELFGHTKGAFTGASEARTGLVRTAHGGCLFLDEVGDLPLSAQVKLLRVIETDVVQPVGSDKPYRVDVRFLAATHRDLAARVRDGGFRADLYQRLAGLVIRLPSLRERPEDVAEIGARFVAHTLEGVPHVDPGPILRWLKSAEARRHPWPGNVRELCNVLRNLLLGLPTGLGPREPAAPRDAVGVPERIRNGEAALHEVEAWYTHAVLQRCAGNLAAAARLLGVDRGTLRRKL